MIKKLVKAQNGISHIQSSSAVLNLPPSSSHSLAGEAPDKKRRKRKSAKGRQRHREEQMKNTSQGFLTSLGLIPSSPSPHFVLHGCVLKFFLSCFFFYVVLLTSLCWRLLPLQVSLQTAGRNAHRRGTEWVGLCNWTANKLSRVKVTGGLFRIVTPAPLYKTN